jgi:acetyltransferase-like isoleucine patch superfamily enzyme
MKKNNICRLFIFFPKNRVWSRILNIWPSNFITDHCLRAAIARFFGAQIGKRAIIRKPVYFSHPRNITIGDDFQMAGDSHFDAMGKITIGNCVTLGPHTLFITGNHEKGPHTDRCGPSYAQPITIEDGCWIAAGVMIGPGVTIGAGSIVSAGAVVLRSMPPDSLIAGNPARVIQVLE